jgi:hypothetical protein
MFTSTKMIQRLFIIAGLSVVAASASAFSMDPQIVIDRALDSPTLTVRYSGVSAALVELKVNGESLGTRSLSSSKSSGETNFTLNLSDLREGDNDVEVRLFDRTGRLIGHEHTNIQTDAVPQRGPVILQEPRMGATVLGPVEIKVQMDHSIHNAYVSFFIDGNFKSMSNYPPFNYVWDTERETNGWHQLEAWAIDDSNETHKTRKLRVFVNNPQGRTDRPGVGEDLVPSKTSSDFTVSSSNRNVKHISIVVPAPKASGEIAASPTVPSVKAYLATKGNRIEPVLSSAAGTKAVPVTGYGITMGPHHMLPAGIHSVSVAKVASAKPAEAVKHPAVVSVTPHVSAASPAPVTQTRVAVLTAKRVSPVSVVKPVEAATNLVSISRGSRLPNLGIFSIALDSSFVDFHGVDPRVDDGVPMTPFRFLLEKAGGNVNWENQTKQVHAKTPGRKIDLKIGDSVAQVNQSNISLERPPYLDRGRTIVPLSFIRSTLNVQVQYDKKTGHVLITSIKK